MRDLKPIFDWARQNGDANIYDRILMKVMPQLIKENIKLTADFICNSEIIEVKEEIYELIKQKAQELLDKKFDK